MLAIAYLVGIWLLTRKAEREGLPKNEIADLSICDPRRRDLGSKLLLAIVDFKDYVANPRSALELIRSGGVFQGGFIAATIVGIWYIRKHGLPVWRVTDMRPRRSLSARRSAGGDASRRAAATGNRRTFRGRSRSRTRSRTKRWERP